MTRETTFGWERIPHVYIPGYRLVRLVDYISTENAVPGWSGDVVVHEDLNRSRWLWGYTLKRRGERRSASGHEPTLTEAQAAAEAAAGKLGGP